MSPSYVTYANMVSRLRLSSPPSPLATLLTLTSNNTFLTFPKGMLEGPKGRYCKKVAFAYIFDAFAVTLLTSKM